MTKNDMRRTRVPAIRLDFGKEQILTGMSAPESGPLTFFDENGAPVAPLFVEVDATYYRKKGLKTINRIISVPTDIGFNQNRSLLRYKHVVAIDTNTRIVNGIRTSISVSAYVTNIKVGEKRWSANIVDQDAFEFQDSLESPEKVGWYEFSALIVKAKLEVPIAIIVDSHLSELRAINERSQPICRNYYLPEGMELIYASADAGGVEFVANSALSYCDKTAKMLARMSESRPNLFFRPGSLGSPYSRFRCWGRSTSTETWILKP